MLKTIEVSSISTLQINDCAMKFDGAQVSTSAMLLGMLIIF